MSLLLVLLFRPFFGELGQEKRKGGDGVGHASGNLSREVPEKTGATLRDRWRGGGGSKEALNLDHDRDEGAPSLEAEGAGGEVESKEWLPAAEASATVGVAEERPREVSLRWGGRICSPRACVGNIMFVSRRAATARSIVYAISLFGVRR